MSDWKIYTEKTKSVGDVHMKITDKKGKYIEANIGASARGANCYISELPALIKALQEALPAKGGTEG